MKLWLLFFGLFFFASEVNACSCFGEQSLCNYTQNDIANFEENGLICMAESTGNHMGDYFESYYEMKIVNHLYGEIQPGDENFENTDSTFWLVLGAGATCYDGGFFGNKGDQFVMAPLYGTHFFENKSIEGYSLYLCVNDAFRYADTMTGPIIQDALFDEEFIWHVDTIEADNLISVITDCTNLLINEVDENTNTMAEQVEVYPNPAGHTIQVNFGSSFLSNETLSIELTDMNGKIHQKQTINNFTSQVDVSDLAVGIYFLNIQQNYQMVSKRILICK